MSILPRTRVIIVNYRTPLLVVDCLDSLYREFLDDPDDPFDVILIDNCSPDDSYAILDSRINAMQWGSWVTLLMAADNSGFAAGNNLGIRKALTDYSKAEYLFLLNPDTRIRPRAIRDLVKTLDANSRVGIVGSLLENEDGSPRNSCFRYPNIWTEFWNYAPVGKIKEYFGGNLVFPTKGTVGRVPWVSGASFMVRRQVFEDIGLLDEHYFLYFEETDFCFRAQQRGWECWHVPSSRVVHLCGQSTGVTSTDANERRRPSYWFRSRAYYFYKNHGFLYLWVVNVLWLLSQIVSQLVRIMRLQKRSTPKAFMCDFLRYSFCKLNGGR